MSKQLNQTQKEPEVLQRNNSPGSRPCLSSEFQGWGLNCSLVSKTGENSWLWQNLQACGLCASFRSPEKTWKCMHVCVLRGNDEKNRPNVQGYWAVVIFQMWGSRGENSETGLCQGAFLHLSLLSVLRSPPTPTSAAYRKHPPESFQFGGITEGCNVPNGTSPVFFPSICWGHPSKFTIL